MIKVAQLNITSEGSTGRIMQEIHKTIQNDSEITCKSFYGRGKKLNHSDFIKFGTEISFVLHVLFTFVTNKQGHYAKFQTKKLIKKLELYQPDLIHMHNIHGYYLNYPMFFDWLIHSYQGKIVWTLHDCWAFTGHCSYFVKAECDQWKTNCHNCPQKRSYPYSLFFDTSEKEYILKRKYFSGLCNVVITTPSVWMKGLVQNSYLKNYPVQVVNNWVDLNVFSPVKENKVLEKYGIPLDKKIVLGVANIWESRKGLLQFLELSKRLSSEYQIVMLGLNKMQIKKLPSKIIGLERTENVKELAEIYSNSYVLLNPSIEESFSLITLEALACNIPVIVQNTSAVHEMVREGCGVIVSDFEMESYLKAIEMIATMNREHNAIRNSVLSYNKFDKIQQFIELYKGV